MHFTQKNVKRQLNLIPFSSNLVSLLKIKIKFWTIVFMLRALAMPSLYSKRWYRQDCTLGSWLSRRFVPGQAPDANGTNSWTMRIYQRQQRSPVKPPGSYSSWGKLYPPPVLPLTLDSTKTKYKKSVWDFHVPQLQCRLLNPLTDN